MIGNCCIKPVEELKYHDKKGNIIPKEEWEKIWSKNDELFNKILPLGEKSIPIQYNINKEDKFIDKALEIGRLVTEKNKAYGNSFVESAKILKILYPDGIKPEQYIDALSMVRIIDKQFRIANKKDAFGENPWMDINGYSLLALVNEEDRKK